MTNFEPDPATSDKKSSYPTHHHLAWALIIIGILGIITFVGSFSSSLK